MYRRRVGAKYSSYIYINVLENKYALFGLRMVNKDLGASALNLNQTQLKLIVNLVYPTIAISKRIVK